MKNIYCIRNCRINLVGMLMMMFMAGTLIACSDRSDKQTGNDSQNTVTAEVRGKDAKQTNELAKLAEKEDFIALTEENMPEFPGGTDALNKFLVSNIRYPIAAKEAGIEGKVMVSFTVDQNGKVNDVKIIRGVNPELDAEALRVVSMMPDWKPGTPGKVSMTLPIQFKLAMNQGWPYLLLT
jgi:TonB family protein